MTTSSSVGGRSAVQNYPKAVFFYIIALLIFASQDGISKHLASHYNAMTIVMIRYWAFAAFVVMLTVPKNGIKAVARSQQPWMQFGRGVLLGFQVILAAYQFAVLGLVDTHVIFASYPIIITIFSIPLLGEQVGWARRLAVLTGFIGVLVIVQPGSSLFDPMALLPLFSAALFALYNIMTRYVARTDHSDTSFFWTGIGGLLISSAIGPFFWHPPQGFDWVWMMILCVTGASGHFLMIKALEISEASSLQPFSYLQLVFAASIGVIIFGGIISLSVYIGGSIIIASGLFTIWRERIKKQQKAPLELQ